jgi:hypothetical protein
MYTGFFGGSQTVVLTYDNTDLNTHVSQMAEVKKLQAAEPKTGVGRGGGGEAPNMGQPPCPRPQETYVNMHNINACNIQHRMQSFLVCLWFI